MTARAGIILVKDGRVAMIERHRPGVHYFVFPGGGVDEGEPFEDAARREAHEELGLEVELVEGSVVRMRTPSEHRYFRVRAIGGTFGTGTGPEYTNPDPWKGSYRAVWLPIVDLASVRVVPRVLSGFIVRTEQNGWPSGETKLIEWAWLEGGPTLRPADPFVGETTAVAQATMDDIPAWLRLASEVDDLFGEPMSTSGTFRQTLEETIERRSAYCVRECWGAPGAPLAGAMLWRPTHDEIGWLAVARASQRRWVGSALVDHALSLASGTEVRVTTFSDDVPGGRAARDLYLAKGFEPLGPDSSADQHREVFSRGSV